jgi:hypothetical protein
MSHVFTPAKARLLKGELDFDLPQDFRIKLLLNTTTADTEQDASVLADFSTLGEVTDGSYSEKALTSESVSQDDPNNRGEFHSDTPVEWLGLTTAGTVQGALLYRRVDGTLANDQPIAFIDSGGFPISGSGITLRINKNAEGWLQLT